MLASIHPAICSVVVGSFILSSHDLLIRTTEQFFALACLSNHQNIHSIFIFLKCTHHNLFSFHFLFGLFHFIFSSLFYWMLLLSNCTFDGGAIVPMLAMPPISTQYILTNNIIATAANLINILYLHSFANPFPFHLANSTPLDAPMGAGNKWEGKKRNRSDCVIARCSRGRWNAIRTPWNIILFVPRHWRAHKHTLARILTFRCFSAWLALAFGLVWIQWKMAFFLWWQIKYA